MSAAATAARPTSVHVLDDDSDGDVQPVQASDRRDRTRGAGPSEQQPRQGPSRKRRRGQQTSNKAVCVDLTSMSDSDPDEVQCVLERRAPAQVHPASFHGNSQHQRHFLLQQQHHHQQLNPAVFGAVAPTAANRATWAAQPALPVPPEEPGIKCPICLDPITEMSTTHCGHVFCTPCITQSIRAQKRCPKCRKTLTLKQVHRVFLD